MHNYTSTHAHGQDYNDPKQLLSPSNIDYTALKKYAVEAAEFSTEGALPLTFEKNHRYRLFNRMFMHELSCSHGSLLNPKMYLKYCEEVNGC